MAATTPKGDPGAPATIRAAVDVPSPSVQINAGRRRSNARSQSFVNLSPGGTPRIDAPGRRLAAAQVCSDRTHRDRIIGSIRLRRGERIRIRGGEPWAVVAVPPVFKHRLPRARRRACDAWAGRGSGMGGDGWGRTSTTRATSIVHGLFVTSVAVPLPSRGREMSTAPIRARTRPAPRREPAAGLGPATIRSRTQRERGGKPAKNEPQRSTGLIGSQI